MTATLTAYGRQHMLTTTFLPGTVVPLSNLWVAVTFQPPYLNSSGSDLVALEPPGSSGYVRKAYGTGPTFWEFGTEITLVSKQAVVFPVATADWNWISGWALVTDATAGNIVMSGALKTGATVKANDQVTIPAGGLSVSLYG